jgi:FtsP/CotA-like multicopper oxidase with cupredoxin domain
MLGRQGNVLLVNGQRRPSYQAQAGGRERWRIVNVANGRYFNLSLPGHALRVIGWDGGRIPRSYLTDTLLIAPGERYDVLVDLEGMPGEALPLQTVHYDRGHQVPDPGPLDLLELELGAAVAAPPAGFADEAPDYVPIRVDETTPVERLTLSESEDGAEPSFFINDQRFPEVTPLHGNPDQLAVWEIRNDAEMDHPFHLHGMFFQVLTLNDAPIEHEGLKDTLNIPMKQTARIALRYGTPGSWMFHCHILEHAERGMMGELMLAP